MIIRKKLTLEIEEYYITHLYIINGVLPVKLTQMEITVLASFMSLSGDMIEENRFGTTARKIIKEKLKLSDGGLSNYIIAFRNKGLIVTKDKKEMVHPNLVPNDETQHYQFKLSKINNGNKK